MAEGKLHQQHEALLETQQLLEGVRLRYGMLLALVPEGYLVTNAMGIIEEANCAAATLLGVSPETLVGTPLLLFIGQHDQQAFRTQLSCLLTQRRAQVWETSIQSRNGPLFPAVMIIAVSPSVPGMPTTLFWLFRDLTERQRLEKELQHIEHLTLLGKLAASVSHEIRNPLSTISLYTELLDEEVRQHHFPAALQARMLESLAEIQRARSRMQHIVEDYLALARGWDLQRAPTALGAFVMTFAEDMSLLCATQGITLSVEGLADLGVVRLHQNTFRRALLNLVQDAMDAMPQGGTLTLCGQQNAAHCILEVRDTGIGIPAEQLPQLFMPLHTTKAHGTGLGLYVVQEIMAAHGAGLVVQSKPGHGTTFTITLPREPDIASPNVTNR